MSSALTDHRIHEFRDRVQMGLIASSNLHGLNMTNEMRPKLEEEAIFLTPRSSPYSPNANGAVCYDIPVGFPELEQHPLPPGNVPTSPYMPGSQEDATYINPYGGTPPYSPPYDNSPLSGNCSSPSSVGSLQLDMCSPTIPCTNTDPFSHFLPQAQTCTSMSYSCCDQEVKNAPCINTLAYHHHEQQNSWIMPNYYSIPAVHIEPSSDLPPVDTSIILQDRRMSSSPDLAISYYPPSPHPGNAMQQHPMYAAQDAKLFAESFSHQMNVPTTFNVPTKKTKRQTRLIKPPIEVDDSEIKDIPSSAQLWEFTLRVLKKPKYNNMVCWENQKEGLFRFHDAQAFAALWGKHRNRPNMTYDKVARALRYYYKRNIFTQVGGRLTYRFSDRLCKLYQKEE